MAIILNLAMLCVIGATFYIQDYRYALPTPRPKGYQSLKLSEKVLLPKADGRIALLCFASADCGCSRFNQDHLWELAHQFGSSVRIVEVVEGSNSNGLDSPGETLLDPHGQWAKKCGIYSTPQAVVLDRDGRIAFSGNFNSNRFCSEPTTQFARIALEAMTKGKAIPTMPPSATTPYGCAIPSTETSR